jgi:hypothetical protein
VAGAGGRGLSDDQARALEQLQHPLVLRQHVGVEHGYSLAAGDTHQMLEQQGADAAPLVGILDR